MADNKYLKAIEEIKVAIRQIVAEMELVDKKITSTGNKLASFSSKINARTPNQFNNQAEQISKLQKKIELFVKTQSDLNTRLHDQKRKQELEYSALFEREQKKREAAVNREASVRKSLNAQREREQRALGLIGTAYERLAAKQKLAANNLRNMIVLHGKNSKEVRQATAEYNKYNKKLNEANRATSNFSKNSLGGMVAGFRNLVTAFGLTLGAQGLAGLVKNIFNVIKTLEKLEFTLSTVTDSLSEFNAAQEFLDDITQRFGLNLVSTTERFTKFLAAAKQSNLSFEDTTRIFESVSKASAVLGLRTDELTGVYLALEQMISKGKVTTEELRRQLGERLPGAFGIMAKAIGVSVEELDKMLKKGEVLSSEALPKFARALEEAYGIKNVESVDTLVASQEKLSNSWIHFVDTVNTSKGVLTSVFKGLLNLATETVEGWEKIIQTTEEFNAKKMKEANAEAFEDAEKYANKILESNGKFGKQVLANMIAEQERMVQQQQSNINAITKSSDGNNLILSDETEKQVQKMQVRLGSLTGTLDAYKAVLESTNEVQSTSTEEENKKLEALKGSIAYIEEQIKKLTELREKTATTSNAYHGYTMAIETLNEKLLELQTTFDMMSTKGNKVYVVLDIQGIGNGFDSFDDIFKKIRENIQETQDTPDGADIFGFSDMLENTKNAADEAAEYLKNKNIAQYWADTAEFQRIDEAVKEVFSTFSELYDLDMSKFEFLYDNKKNTMADYADAAKEVIGSVLDASLQRYEIELQEAQRSRDLIVNNELSTEKEKRLAREKFEEEERRIRTERAKQERKNNLIKIAVDTSVAVVKALASAPPPANFVLAGIVGALGVAQAAIVASQPLPKFAEGTKSPLKEDTLAIVGDGGMKEAITENGKLVGVTPDKPTLMRLKKGQEVQKDAKHWIDNAVYKMNMEANGQMLSSFSVDSILYEEIKKLNADNKKTWQEVKKLASRPLNVKNKVIIEEKFSSYKQ